MRPVRVLITNDDGVEAPGLLALTEAVAAAGHDVLVVAPSGQRSGSGAAIGRLHRSGPIAWTEVTWPSLGGIPVHAIDTSPAAAVYAGVLGAFGPPPDAVASGINPGMNSGHLVLHSGTVGAALTAGMLGIPAVAVSIAWSEHPHWDTAGALVPPALDWLATIPGEASVLNLNVPDVPLTQLRGVRAAGLAPFLEQWSATTRPGELLLEYVGRDASPPPGTDLAVALDGYASVTLLHGVASSEPGGAAEAVGAILGGLA